MLPAVGDGGLQHANPLVERVVVLDTLDDFESSSEESGTVLLSGRKRYEWSIETSEASAECRLKSRVSRPVNTSISQGATDHAIENVLYSR
jgi:hypothetical protein